MEVAVRLALLWATLLVSFSRSVGEAQGGGVSNWSCCVLPSSILGDREECSESDRDCRRLSPKVAPSTVMSLFLATEDLSEDLARA